MADISNKTLAVMMVVAILVSLGGLFISLDRLSKLQAGGMPPVITAFATSGTGYANVSIVEVLAITLPDARIDFGECTLTGSPNTLVLESNWTCDGAADCGSMNTTIGNGTCLYAEAHAAPDNITIANTGNKYANISFTSTVTNDTLFSSALVSDFSYKTINYSNAAGKGACGYGGWAQTARGSALSVGYNDTAGWTKIISASATYNVCQNLTTGLTIGADYAKVIFQARMAVPWDEPAGQKNATLTFTANALVT